MFWLQFLGSSVETLLYSITSRRAYVALIRTLSANSFLALGLARAAAMSDIAGSFVFRGGRLIVFSNIFTHSLFVRS